MGIPHIITECTGEHHQAILDALAAGKSADEVAKSVRMSVSTVRRTANIAKNRECFDLFIFNDGTKCPVAKISTAYGFEHACKFALRRWSEFFENLASPNWEFVAGEQRAKIIELV